MEAIGMRQDILIDSSSALAVGGAVSVAGRTVSRP